MARRLAELNRGLDGLLHSYVEALKRVYPASAVLLFGSRARGDHLPYSDYDVALVLPSVGDPLAEAVRARSLKPPRLPADVLVLALDQLRDPLVERMLRGCVVLYDGLGVAGMLVERLGCRRAGR